MRVPSRLTEAGCTATALVLCCGLLCGGLFLLTGVAWLPNAIGAHALILPAFGFGMLANLVLSFILGGELTRRLFPLRGV